MDENIQRLRVGIYSIIVMLILAILIFLNSEGWNSSYNLTMRTSEAPGVRMGTPIRKFGILIGRVAEVTPVDDEVELVLAIRENIRIYENETISIGAESVLGDAGLEVISQPKATRGAVLVSNSRLINPPVIKPNPAEIFSSVLEMQDDVVSALESIETTSDKIGDAATGVETLTSQFSGILTDEDSELKKMVSSIQNLSVKAEATLEDIDTILDSVVTTVTDPEVKENFTKLVQSIPPIFAEFRVGISNVRELVNSFSGVGERVNVILDDTAKFTGAIGEQGPAIVEDIGGGIKDIREVLAEAEGFGDTLKSLQETFGNKDGTVGKLFNDSEAYDEVLAILRNAEEMTSEFKRLTAKLEPILNDARVFTDKAARSGPSGIIRNALKKNPPDSGYKSIPGSRTLFR